MLTCTFPHTDTHTTKIKTKCLKESSVLMENVKEKKLSNLRSCPVMREKQMTLAKPSAKAREAVLPWFGLCLFLVSTPPPHTHRNLSFLTLVPTVGMAVPPLVTPVLHTKREMVV